MPEHLYGVLPGFDHKNYFFCEISFAHPVRMGKRRVVCAGGCHDREQNQKPICRPNRGLLSLLL
jgi:hypothetical protein